MPGPAFKLSGALAAVLILSGALAVFTVRSNRGSLPHSGGEGGLRSQAVAVDAPVGDLDSRPVELRWQAVPGAATYSVEILEVDRHSLWKSATAQIRLSIPANIRALMAPGKTLLWQVSAVNSSGAVLATSGFQKFRVKVKKNGNEEL